MLAHGAVLACGYGSRGRLGQGDVPVLLRAALLDLPVFGGEPVVLVACGGSHTLAVTGRVSSCSRHRRKEAAATRSADSTGNTG